MAAHGHVGGMLSPDGSGAETTLSQFRKAGVDEVALAELLQREGADSFDNSWHHLLDRLAAKRAALTSGAHAVVGA